MFNEQFPYSDGPDVSGYGSRGYGRRGGRGGGRGGRGGYDDGYGDSRGRGGYGGRGPGFGPGGPGFGPGGPGFGPGGPGFAAGFDPAGPGFGHGFGHGSRGPRGRRRRGGLRIALLTLLSEQSPLSGSELIQKLAERSLGRRTPSASAVYPALQLLEDDGLVTGSTPESGSGRAFELTDEGKAFLDKLGDASDAFPSLTGDLVKLRRTVIATIAAARQVGFTGNAEDLAKATELIDEARKGLYRLLADSNGQAGTDDESVNAED